MKTFAIAVALMTTTGLIGTAQATAVRNVRHQVVSYADLNLQDSADAAILLARIKNAAREVCGVRRAPLIPMELRVRFDACAEDATARAIADVNAPLLSQRREIVVNNLE
jgi:UrcA family protein